MNSKQQNMNKQDKIKKVMREFKNGKLKTPNGEVVTDKKQALAIAMSESEDYAEKADLIEDISIGSFSDAEDVIKGIGSEELFEKAVYADTPENRKLGRVGQEYHRGKGTKKETDSLVGENGEINEDNEKVKRWRDLSDRYNSIKERKTMTANEIAEMSNIQREIMKQKFAVKKSFDDEMGISDAYCELFGDDLEKAHQDGDIHPKHPDWVWVSSASGGKGDWRKAGGRVHKKHQETNGKQGNEQSQTKTIADHASETKTETLEKVVNSNASTQLKQAAQKELKKREGHKDGDIHPKHPDWVWVSSAAKGKGDWRKSGGRVHQKHTDQNKKQSSTTQNAHVEKLIDFYKTSNSNYTDTSKMSIVITPKGNWNLRYDGKDVSTISGQGNAMDRKTLEAAGIKFEESKKRPVGAGTNGPTPKTKADKKADDNKSSVNVSDAIKQSGLFGSGYVNGKHSMGDIASINIGDPDTRNGNTPATVIYTTFTGAYKTVSVTIDAKGKVTKNSGWQSSQSFSSLDDAKSYVEYGRRGRNIFTKKWEDEPGHGSTTKNNQGKTGKDFNIVGARAKDVADNVASVLGGKVTGEENVKVSGIPGATIKAYKITVGNDSFFIHDGVYERSYSQKGYARYKGFTVMKSDGSRIMKYKVNAAGTHFTNAFSRNAGELGSYIKQTWGYGK